MKRIAIILGFLLCINTGKAQDIKDLARLFCDSLEITDLTNQDSLRFEQLRFEASFLSDTLSKIFEKNKDDFKNQFNVFSYKLFREISKTCPKYLYRQPKPLHFTKVIDFDSVFSIPQKDSLETIITEIRRVNNVQILVAEIDDFYPYDSIEDLYIQLIEDWDIGAGCSKGGVLIIFSKTLRKIGIATSNVAQGYLSDYDCRSIIDKTIIPDFKAELYFRGIYNSLSEIKKKF